MPVQHVATGWPLIFVKFERLISTAEMAVSDEQDPAMDLQPLSNILMLKLQLKHDVTMQMLLR